MLMFLYSLEAVLPKVRSFAFSSDLGEVSELFSRNTIDDAIALALRQYGGGSTDYGQAFADFGKLCLADIDSRTTVIILGDARNNYGDARTDALKEIYDRAKPVIWLNPERENDVEHRRLGDAALLAVLPPGRRMRHVDATGASGEPDCCERRDSRAPLSLLSAAGKFIR